MTVTINGTSGITTPEVTLDNTSADGGQVVLKSSGYDNWNLDNYSGRLRAYNGSTERMTIDTSGNVGIGTTTPQGKLDVRGILAIANSNASYWALDRNDSDGALTFTDTSTERMRITSGGDVSLGGSPAAPPTVANDIFAGGLYLNPNRRTTGSGANTFFDSSSGAFFRSTSSIKYKTDVNDATYGLADVLSLRPVTYKGKSDADTNKVFGGFIAEEVDALGLKEFVEYDSEGNPDSLAYGNMVSLLTKAIQEQQAIISDLKARIETLEQSNGS